MTQNRYLIKIYKSYLNMILYGVYLTKYNGKIT